MNKRILQDMVPLSTPPSSSASSERRTAGTKPPRGTTSRVVVMLGSVGAFAVLLFALTGFVSKATVYVTPKTETVNLDYSLRARKGSIASDLHFELVTHSVEASDTVPASGTEKVERKARGTIVVYNAYSSTPQPLVASTRFEAKNGNVYRIESDVIIPGTSGGLPGSKEVEVTADQVGASGNVGLTDFTVPGFKGSPKYDKFYGRSKTEMTGGFSGEIPKASPEEIAEVLKRLETKLTEQVRREAFTEVPEGFVPYEGGVRVSFKDRSETTLAGGEAPPEVFTVRASANLQAYLFNEQELTTLLARRALKEYEGGPIEVVNLRDLDVVLTGVSDATFETTDDIIFRLRGPATFAYGYSEEELKKGLAGQRKSNYKEVLRTFPSLVRADAEMSPFWSLSFPTNPDRIKVVRRLPAGVLKDDITSIVEPVR